MDLPLEVFPGAPQVESVVVIRKATRYRLRPLYQVELEEARSTRSPSYLVIGNLTPRR